MSADGDGGPKQRFELYIKASAIDKETKGSCPICQHWFMITCLLGENQDDIDFKVYTVQADCPPKNFGVEQGWSKKFPVVMVLEGRDKMGQDLSGTKYDTFEELEMFFEAINRKCPQLKRKNAPNVAAMKAVESVYNAFNSSLSTAQPNKKLFTELKKVNDFLDQEYTDATFLVDDVLSFSDCYLLPRLQHIRVAGKEYMDFDIPAEYLAIWRYLTEAYLTEAFRSTMPSDQDIVFHYEKKASNAIARKKRRPRPTLQNFTYTLDIPEEIAAMLQRTSGHALGANGNAGEEEAPVEQMSTIDIAPQDQHGQEEEDQIQRAGFEADDIDYAAIIPPPPPLETEEELVMEQTALVEAAPPPPQDDPTEESLYENVSADDVITADQADVIHASPPPSPPPPPAVDYEIGCGDSVAGEQDQTEEKDEPNYMNIDIIHGCGNHDGGQDQETPCSYEADGVKTTVSHEEDHCEVRNEVGNGDVIQGKGDSVVTSEDHGVAQSTE